MDRKGVLMVMFDLPVAEKTHQKAYRKFKNHLLKNGYRIIQKSLYVKLLHNISNSQTEILKVKFAAPSDGNIQLLPLSLANFKKMTSVCGVPFDMEFFSDDLICL